MPPSALNLLVFREARRRVCSRDVKSALLRNLADFPVQSSPDVVMAALLRAGELECAVADADHALARAFSPLTDRLAEGLLCSGTVPDVAPLIRNLGDAVIPDELCVSPPEGFAYYALHPLAYAAALEQIHSLAGSVLVIGIRSIGTTLSAVTAAAARQRGLRAQRITVRPAGHPYNRRTQFSPEQADLIRQSASSGSKFVVVDEGPGLSGSSFLSAAEALEEAGVPPEAITLICGHQPDFDSLRADDAPRRARRFRWVAVSSELRRPVGAGEFVGGGEWRRLLFGDQRHWPASWTTLERLKYLSFKSGANRTLFKFLGFGHHGEQVLEREDEAAAAGFAPRPRREGDGFVSYDWLLARPMAAGDLSEAVLERLAEYCVFRAQVFPANIFGTGALEQMAEHNLRELGVDLPVELEIERPVICDGRMQPHEWLLTRDGRMLKSDSGGHGDDHFFPGPTDVAWDLAGAIVEWRMNAGEKESFLAAYRRASRDDARDRITNFTIAYTAFRLAYCRMAGNALHAGGEAARLRIAAAAYGEILAHFAQPAVP